MANEPDSNHHYLIGKIADYTQAFDRCKQIVEHRSYPEDMVIQRLKKFPKSDIERFLMSKSVLARHACEKPEITDLAYAILVLENESLQRQTRDAIAAIKVLAFSADDLRFQQVYRSTPKAIRLELEGLGYFDRPFDDRLLLDLIR